MTPLVLLTLLLSAKATDIALLHRPPQKIDAARAFSVAGTMVGASEVEHAEVRYRMAGVSFYDKVELELKQGEDYEGVIPAERVRPGMLEYYVVAFDFLGKTREVFASAKRPQRVAVEAPQEQTPTELGRRDAEVRALPKQSVDERAPREEPAAPPPSTFTALDLTRFVFERDDLDLLAALTVADVLERIPELQLSRAIDGRVQSARFGLRDDAAVLVLLDGQPLGSMATGAPDLRLPVTMYERIEVTTLNASATELSAPLATVKLTTRKHKLDARLLAGGSLSHTTGPGARSIGTYDAAISGGAQLGAFGVFARGGAHYSSGAQLLVREDQLSSGSLSAAPGLTNDSALRLHGGTTLSLRLPAEHRLQLDADFIHLDHGHYAGAYDLFSPSGSIGSETLRARLQLTAPVGKPWDYALGLGYRLLASNDVALVAPAGYALSDRNGDGMPEVFSDGVTDIRRFIEHVFDAEAKAGLAIGRAQRLRVQADFAQHVLAEAAFARDDGSDLAQPSQTSRSALQLAIADKIAPVAWLDIDIGVRFSLAGDVGVATDELASLLTPVASISLRPFSRSADDGLLLRLSYDTSVRAPTSLERDAPMPFDSRGLIANPSLRYMALRQAAFDIVYAGVSGPLKLRGEARVQYFGARGARMGLDRDGLGDAWSDAMQTDGIAASGFLRAGFASRSWVRMGASWHRAFAQVSGIDAVTLLTDTPQLSAVLMGRIELGPIGDLFLGATFTSERRANARTDEERRRAFRLPASAVVSAQFSTRAFYGFRATLLAQNLFDAERFDPPPRPDRLPGLVPREGFRLLGGITFALEERP